MLSANVARRATLLLDTVYVMPGDSLDVPVVVLKSSAPSPVVWFEAPASNGVYTIDSVTGRLTDVRTLGV